jgi:hypothetical protein
VVRGQTGLPLAGVSVQLAGLQLVTGQNGEFLFEGLREGGYTVTLQSAGGDFDCRSIVVADGQSQYEFSLPGNSPGFRVTSVSPRVGSGGNELGTVVKLDLSGALASETLAAADFRFTPDIGDFSVEISSNRRSITLTPRLQLEPSLNLTLEVVGDLRMLDGSALSLPVRWSFRTSSSDTSAPRLLDTVPSQGTQGIALNQSLQFEFNETLSSSQLSISVKTDPERIVQVQSEGRYIVVTPLNGWMKEADHVVTIENVVDLVGNTFSGPYSLRFSAGAQDQISQNIQPDWNRLTNQIVFASDRSGVFEIWCVRPDGSDLRQLTASGQTKRHPSLSQDGRRLAFQMRAENGLWDIYVATLDGTGLGPAARITPLEFNDYDPYFSRGPSNRIVFVSNRGQTTGLFSMNEDGSSPVELDPAFGLSASQPAFHPLLDGQLLFTAFSGSERDVWRKSISISDGSTVNTNMTAGRLSDDHSPAWGPDASFFVFISNFDGVANLWLAEATGEFPRQVTSSKYPVSHPCLSPLAGDNSCLVSVARPDGGSDLQLVSLTSGEVLRNITSPNGVQP